MNRSRNMSFIAFGITQIQPIWTHHKPSARQVVSGIIFDDTQKKDQIPDFVKIGGT